MAKVNLVSSRVDELKVSRKNEVQGNSLGAVSTAEFYVLHMPHKQRADKGRKRGSYKAKRELLLV